MTCCECGIKGNHCTGCELRRKLKAAEERVEILKMEGFAYECKVNRELRAKLTSTQSRLAKVVLIAERALIGLKTHERGPCSQSCACLDRARIFANDALSKIRSAE